MKLLRTIQLDASDTFVFERAAEPGEWAVPGTFAFTAVDVARLEGKARMAFRSGFLGIDSLGWSTLVQVVEASDEERAAAIDLLSRRLVERFGAPDAAAARAAAEEEIAFAASLSNHAESTVVALARRHENGDVRETFRTLAPGAAAQPARAFRFVEAADEEEAAPVDEIDLAAIARERARE